ncbi:MAG: TfoX/Sxy family protein [Eudoraea sp.]|nr:TfoX/Sxy family protein [Eudoraea sp.]NNL01436.1 TfoX/Sxy family protein [Eudoraea sp.]
MAYNEELAKRIRLALKLFPASIIKDFQEKKMFGGLAFLYRGKMTVGIIKNDLMVRVLSNKVNALLAKNYVRPMDFTNRPLKEFIYVSEQGFNTEEQLQHWIELGLEHARSKLNEK